MEYEIKPTTTCFLAAYLRGYHAACDSPKIFDDYLSHQILGKDICTFYEQNFSSPNILRFLEYAGFKGATQNNDKASALAMAIPLLTPLSLMVSVRRYTEDKLEQAVRQGVRQYVILGAGMDTFAFRRPSMLEKLQVFEVDLPHMQEYKRRRLTELCWSLPEQLHFVTCDFTQETLSTALARSSYDPQAPSFFSWLGVTYYLPRDAVIDTLSNIAKIALPGSTIVLDYVHKDVFLPEKTSQILQIGLKFRQQHGEPWLTGFDPSEFAADLASIGLRIQEHLTPHDVEERFFQGRTDSYHAYEHAHFVSAIVE
jgi:methyltransferase (TIGR00027 family)